MAAKELCATMGGFEGGAFNRSPAQNWSAAGDCEAAGPEWFVGGVLSVYPLVIPGRRVAASPESITTAVDDGVLRLSACEQEAWHALSERDERYRAACI